MELLDLKLFCDIVELRSFTEAARQNNLTQSAVSQRMSKLNEFYSGKLFIDKKKLVISWHGNYVYQKFKDILKIYSSTEDIVQNSIAKNIIGIGFSENSKLKYLSPEFIHLILEKHLLPEVYIGPSQSVFEKIIFGALDYGIVGNKPSGSNDIIMNKLYSEEIVLATSTKSTTEPLDIFSIPLLLDHRDSGLYQFLKYELQTFGIEINRFNIRGYVGTSMDKTQMLLAGNYYSFIPAHIVSDHSVFVQIPLDFVLKRDFYEIYLRKKAAKVSILRKIISISYETIS